MNSSIVTDKTRKRKTSPNNLPQNHAQPIRNKMISQLLLVIAACAPVLLFFSLIRINEHGWNIVYIFQTILASIALLGAIFRHKIQDKTRNLIFLCVAFSVGVLGIFSFGLLGGGSSVLIISTILIAIGFGTRAGLIACTVNLIVLISIGILVCTNVLNFSFDIADYATSPSAWAPVIANFALLLPMAVIALRSVFHQLEYALQEIGESHAAQERLSKNLVNSFLYRYSADGELQYASSVETVLGYTTKELAVCFPDLLTNHPVNESSFKFKAANAIEGKQAPFEIQVYHKDRSKRWLHMSETAVRTPKGIQYEGIAIDITQRKIRSMALENILQAFAEKSELDFYDAILIQLANTLECDIAFLARYTDTDKNKVRTDSLYMDGSIVDNMEYEIKDTPCEVTLIQGAQVYPSDVYKHFPKAPMLQQLQVEGYAGIPIIKKNGDTSGFMVALWKEPTFDKSLILPILKLFTEYIVVESERREEQIKLEKLEEQLRHSQKMDAIGQLAGGIAHDFNNMLMGIMGAADLLKPHLNETPESLEYYTTINTSCQRASKLTRQLLTFARKQPVGTDKADLHQVIYNTVSLLSNTIDRRITMKTDLMAQSHTVIGDSAQLQNVLMNLCINAAQAMPNGGSIQITTRSLLPEQHIEIKISDEGCGIPDELLPKIYDPFFTTKPQGKGTGLGLSAVLGTVQQHSGTIDVESTTNKGTIFTIKLPTAPNEAPKKKTTENERSGAGRILLIEDEPAIRLITSKMLTRLGYEVIATENGDAGLKKFKEDDAQYDLVVLDMEMPEMNGHDCFFAMKKINPTLRAILTSGYSEGHNVEAMLENGLCGVVDKPFSPLELSNAVHNALRSSC